jgi:hypothetical protein
MKRVPIRNTRAGGFHRSRRAFSDFLDHHLAVGTRPEERKPWTNFEFGKMVGDVSERAVRNWRFGEALPTEKMLGPLMDALFGTNPDFRAERDRASRLWKEAESEKLQNRQEPDPELEGSDFTVENCPPLAPGLADLLIYPPPRGNNSETEIPLQVSLSFSELEDVIDGYDIKLSLTDATVVPTYRGCSPAAGSRLGEERTSDNLAFRAGIWQVTGPRPGDRHLGGISLGPSEPLCRLEMSGSPDDSVTLVLRSRPRALVVTSEDPNIPTNGIKEKILQIMLQKSQNKDDDGFIKLGRGNLRRKTV